MSTRARDAGPLVHEIEHTADLGFEVVAPTLAALFERAGLGLMDIMVDLTAVEPRSQTTLAVEAEGLEDLFHDFLQALLVRFQAGGFVVCELGACVSGAERVEVTAIGEPVDPRRHALRAEVKAVTYHELAVRETAGGFWARVIFDV
jgi:SHS2 domain-containing protein